MLARIRRFVRRQKGMEALQAVILLGAGFAVTWGLIMIWDEVKDTVQEQVETIVSSGQ